MAKPKRRKKEAFSIQAYDNAHYKATDAYAVIIQRLFDRCTDIIAAASAKGAYDPDKPFVFSDHPQLRSVMVKATNQLADNMTSTIQSGTRKQWEYANKKCDAFLASIMDTSKLTKKQLEQMELRSLDGLKAFQARKVGGMDLSQRVWRYVEQYKEQIEDALDVGLGEGRDYRQLARDLKSNLREPDRLFRRVRDKRGNLQLSRNAAAYHPGTGVYRSSVKNAQRLARSEVNMAYREADWQRWQSLDFVVGFEVVRSNWRDVEGHEYTCKLCERLKGKYPKSFKFVGWHPQCRCHAIPILADYFSEDASNDRIARMRAALYGTEYKKYVPKETITDLPDGFNEWMKETIAKQKEGKMQWSNPPYFVRDNFRNGNLANGLLNEPRAADASQVEELNMKLSALPKGQQKAIRSRINNLELGAELEDACFDYGISTDHWADMASKAYDDPEDNWRFVDDCDAEKKRLEGECDRRNAMDKATAQRMIGELQMAIQECKKWNGHVADGAAQMLKNYQDHISQEQNKRWWNYTPIVAASCQGQIDGVNKAISEMRTNWAQVKADAKNVIDAATDKTSVAKLAALVNEKPRVGRDAKTIIQEIKTELAKIKTGGMFTSDQVDNHAELEKEMGIKQGVPMTFEEADEGKGNPNYGKGLGYSINCQSCVVADEMRRRGFNVEAQFNYGDNTNGCHELSGDTTKAWIDPTTGKHPVKVNWDRKTTDKDGTEITIKRKSKSAIAAARAFLDAQTSEVGRYDISYLWQVGKRRGGHIICAERLKDGTLRIYDPQINRKYTIDEFEKSELIDLNYSGRWPPLGITKRVDKLKFDISMVKRVTKQS